MDWFRSYHGAPTDPKWLAIAKRAETLPGVAACFWWALEDYASQHEDRGSVAGFDVESFAAFSGFDEKQLCNAFQAFQNKGMIVDQRLKSWDKRQPKRDDNSTERVRAFRERQKRNETQAEPTVTPRGEEIREEYIEGAPKRARQKGSRLPEGWTLSDDGRTYALGKGLTAVDITNEAAKFANYWHAKAGAGATKLDWDKTWQTWVLTFLERNPRSAPRAAAATPSNLTLDESNRLVRLERLIETGGWFAHHGPKPDLESAKAELAHLQAKRGGKEAA